MRKSELKLAAAMLRLASEQFSNHGCNDMDSDILRSFAPEERAELLACYNAYTQNQDPEWVTENLNYTHDHVWMSVLAKNLEKEAA